MRGADRRNVQSIQIKSLTVEKTPYTVVGVTGPDFFGPDVGRAFDVAVPIGTEPLFRGKESFLDQRSTWWLTVMARLKRDQTVSSATAASRSFPYPGSTCSRRTRITTTPTSCAIATGPSSIRRSSSCCARARLFAPALSPSST